MWPRSFGCSSHSYSVCWILSMLHDSIWDIPLSHSTSTSSNFIANPTSDQLGTPGIASSFDYIVLGGGTAGVTLAVRLAEAEHSVALVEAGDFYQIVFPFVKIPVASVIGVQSDPDTRTPIDWGFVARDVPGANYRDIHFARGKCLGGSSSINYMLYQRPSIGSLQRWADLVDDQSYTFDKVLPFYNRPIQFTPPDESARAENATVQYNIDSYDNEGGPVQVAYPNFATSFASWLKLGLESVGVNETEDFNSGSILGAQYSTFAIDPGHQKRSSSDTPLWVSWPPSLKLYKNTMAKQILFNSEKHAVGARVQTAFKEYRLHANREVIVSAGAFQSPQLLMVSGIGPKSTLEEHDIDLIVDLPGVGQNMWDHPFFGPTYQVAVETHTKVATSLKYLLKQLFKYVTTKTGVMTNSGADYLAFEKLPDEIRDHLSEQTQRDLAWFTDDWPEIEYMLTDIYLGNFSHPITSQPRDGKQYATIAVVLIAPTSRGNVTISSADTSDLPVINPNWLATETDQEVVVAAYRRAREIFRSEAMAPIVIGDEFFPGDEYETDAEILDIIRDTMMTLYHPSCTCKMGTPEDPMAVVDSRGRVFGVTGLRVVDASAFPFLPPGHPQSTAYMLAEKIAADILSQGDER